MSSPPIVNPDVPYTGKIPDNLNPGEMVRIQGITLPNADRFNINLQTGTTGDIALHISARLNQGYVARNSYQNGAWEDEQGDGTLPIGPGQQFEVIILADPRHYKIAINGQHFCEFPHRVPINKVTHLIINGDLKITLISWEGNIPSAPPAGADVASSQASTVHSSGPQDGPPPPQFNPQQQQGGYGPPPSGYGPPPSGYGPGPQGPYGRPGYGPPPAPGAPQESGFGSFLDSAQEVLAGAIQSGAAEKLLSGLLSSGGPGQQQQGGGGGYNHQNAQYGQYPHPPPQSQSRSQTGIPQFGGEGSIGGLGSVGSFLSSLAGEVLKPSNRDRQRQNY